MKWRLEGWQNPWDDELAIKKVGTVDALITYEAGADAMLNAIEKYLESHGIELWLTTWAKSYPEPRAHISFTEVFKDKEV